MLRKGHACHRILIQSEKYFAKTKKADDYIITVGQNKRHIKEIITTCLETQLDLTLHVWLEKLKTKGSLKQTSEMIEEIKAIRKQLILGKRKTDVPCIDSKPIVPKNVREYLLRRSGVTGFGIWGCSGFKIFVEMATDDKMIKRELIKLNKNFFEKYHLNIETRNMAEKQTMRRYNSSSLKYKLEGQFQKLFTKPYDKRRNWTITLLYR